MIILEIAEPSIGCVECDGAMTFDDDICGCCGTPCYSSIGSKKEYLKALFTPVKIIFPKHFL